jgi:hypothetical protein
MERKQKDYSKGKIYIIRNTENNKVYIGSTCQTLAQRMTCHRKVAKPRQHYVLYQAFNDIGVHKFYIELIEDYPCERSEQLFQREGFFIRKYNSVNNGYNMKFTGRCKKEYYEENKELITQKKKQYHEDNKELITQKKKQYYEDNKENILQKNKQYDENNKEHLKQKRKQWREDNKEVITQKKKQYYEKNKEQITQKNKQYFEENKDKNKEYYEKNKDKINEKRKEKIECECGCEVRKDALSKHKKTAKHQQLMLQSQQ